jgi:ribosome-binding protein aMBF1 (putative translation factor)
MIRNEREYRITKAQAAKFRQALEKSAKAPPPKGVHPRLQKASVDGMRAQLADLERELQDYDALQRGTSHLAGRLEHLGDLLVQARIARGWTQRELAERLGLHMQKIQQYEATSYVGASAARLLEVARALGLICEISVSLVPLPDRSELGAGRVSRATGARQRGK